MTKHIERRANTGVELRKKETGEDSLFGYAAVFNRDSEPLYNAFIERLAPGCFDDALKGKPDILCRMQHEGGLLVLGRTKSGTLRVGVDARGLWYEVDLPNTTAGRDILELVKRGDISESSFAFGMENDEDEEWERPKGKLPVRTIKRVSELVDVAPVSNPAYKDTEVSARAIEKAGQAPVDIPVPPELSADSARARIAIAEKSN